MLFKYFFDKFTVLTFYKVDCEGHESSAMQIINHLKQEQRPVFIEYENNYRLDNNAKLLLSLHYEPLVLFDSFAEIWYDSHAIKDKNRLATITKSILTSLIAT